MEKYLKLHPYYATATIVLLISIAYVSLMPLTGLPKTEFDHTDKIVHLTVYFILTVVMAKAFINLKNAPLSIKAIPMILSFIYSFFIEISQSLLTNYRFFEIFDILANGIGCLLALMLINTQFFNKKTITK